MEKLSTIHLSSTYRVIKGYGKSQAVGLDISYVLPPQLGNFRHKSSFYPGNSRVPVPLFLVYLNDLLSSSFYYSDRYADYCIIQYVSLTQIIRLDLSRGYVSNCFNECLNESVLFFALEHYSNTHQVYVGDHS